MRSHTLHYFLAASHPLPPPSKHRRHLCSDADTSTLNDVANASDEDAGDAASLRAFQHIFGVSLERGTDVTSCILKSAFGSATRPPTAASGRSSTAAVG